MKSRALSALWVAGVLALGTRSLAAPCNRPDLQDAVPPDGAVGVPTNASLSAIYVTSAEYLGEEIPLKRVSTGEVQTLQGTWVPVEGVLSVTPEAPLEPGELYEISWPRLRGVATATLGQGRDVTLQVGSGEDTELPVFDGVTGVEWDVAREKDPCTDATEERYIFDIEVPDAIDDGGRDSLTLLVFQTRGRDVAPGAPEPVLVRRLPPPGGTLRVTKTIDDAVGEVCFAALVRDSTGKVSGGGNREQCVETVEPPFFYGCAVQPRRSGSGSWLAALALMLLTARSGSRRCARRR